LWESRLGTDIVDWQGTIERQIVKKIEEYEESKNPDYANKLREYLKVWRANTLTGSVNVETLNVLLSATDMLAVDGWKQSDYFSNLRDRIRVLKAEAEQLPPVPDEAPGPRNKPRLVGQSTMGAPSTDFGPQREKPGELKEPGEQAAEDEDEVAELERNKLEGEEAATPAAAAAR
jgi:hypothetical protein